MSRKVPEWVGKTDDSPIPPRVRLRILHRYDFKCYRSGRPIRSGDSWQCDHILALINGGKHAESNLAPILIAEHKMKTREDLAIKAKRDKSQKKRFGITKPKHPIPGSKASGVKKHLDGTVSCRRTGRILNRRDDQ